MPPASAASDESINPYVLPDFSTALNDLHQRLRLTRWPSKEPVSDTSQGAPLSKVRSLAYHWLHNYSWHKCASLVSSLPQFNTTIDGLNIYFLHIKSPHPEALPLLLTHGWPGSILEFRHVIGPLIDPPAHGGDAADAFDLVVPALPGYAFSAAPESTGYSFQRIAQLWIKLMKRLGYRRWVAQGGDWGADVTIELGRLAPPGLLAVHVNSLFFNVPTEISADPSADELHAKEKHDKWTSTMDGYEQLQRTRPQTHGYSLADSPVGLLAWIYEKLHDWSDHAHGEEAFGVDEMLDNVMLYWLHNAGASSARLYWEGRTRRR